MKIQRGPAKGNPENLSYFNILLTGFCYFQTGWPFLPYLGPICRHRNLLK